MPPPPLVHKAPLRGGCAHALSLPRQPHAVPTLCPMPYNMPLWHNVLFRNQHKQTYFCPRLIRDGGVSEGSFLEDDSSRDLVAPTWKPAYNVLTPPNTAGERLDTNFWAS